MTETFEHIGTLSTTMVLNNQPRTEDPAMTVCIAGMPRGGTTMVAAVVHALGVDLGPEEDLRGFTFEDQMMNRPYPDEVHKYIKKRDAEQKVWGWKDPGAIHPFNDLAHALRNPRVILVFRDTFAVVQSEMKFDEANEITGRTFETLVESVQRRLEENCRFIERTRVPLLLVSYEKAIINRDSFVSEVAAFLGLPIDSQLRQEAVDRISPSGGYLQW